MFDWPRYEDYLDRPDAYYNDWADWIVSRFTLVLIGFTIGIVL